jgi:predicted amidohydrolase
MTKASIACVQMTSTPYVTDNLEQAALLIAEAARTEAQLIVLPEMFATMGMDQLDKVRQGEAAGRGPIQDFLHAQALQYGVWLVGGTIPIAVADKPARVRAACLVMNDKGEQVARYDKIHLFDVHVASSAETFAESRTIAPGNESVVLDTPVGRMGLAVCYDLRFPEMFRQMLEQNIELLVLPTAFTYATGAAHWDVLVRARAIENQIYVAAACQSGTHANGRKTYGHSMVVNPWGEVIASLPASPGIITAEIDLDYQKKIRQDFPALTHRTI